MRLLLLLGAVAIPSFGFLEEANVTEFDPMVHRYVLSGLWLLTLGGSFYSDYIQRHLVSITCWLMYVTHLWSLWMVDLHMYRPESLIGYVVSFAALNLTFLRPQLYYLFMTSSLFASIVMLYTGPQPAISINLIAFMFGVLWLAFMITSSIIIVSRERLTHLNENLEALVAERSAQAEARAQALARKNEELEQFAFIASHDLKTPLRNIASFVQLIQRRLEANTSAELQEYFHFVNEAVHRMNNLINDILSYSRYGFAQMERRQLDVRNLLEECCFSLASKLQARNASVEFHIECDEILADRNQLQQLCYNLLDNALKYNASDSVEIVVSVVDRPFSWLFSFADNGIGIPKDYHQKVFRMFQRLHNHTQYDGTGLGLALCKRIVENHGGEIWIESEEGQGTTVRFTISKENYLAERYLLPRSRATVN
ncbi:MAG: hypothetical protein KatS3mg029_0144 [Saprospiraceae bacterium]|nr:MAG: hypothetical protein KatS3mg029_0144 [Saprospiraceae bacterium]